MAAESNSTLKGYFNTGDKPTETNFANLVDSCVNTDITVSTNTSDDVNLVSLGVTTTSHKVFLTGTFAADVILPQADTNNKGITITVMCAASTAASGTIRIGFLETGSTVMVGQATIFSDTADQNMSIAIPATSKTLHLDSDAADHAGGAVGSIYIFHYYDTNKVFADARGFTTDNAPAIDTSAFSDTGIS